MPIVIAGPSLPGCGSGAGGGGGGGGGLLDDALGAGAAGPSSAGGDTVTPANNGPETGGIAQSVQPHADAITSDEAYHLLRRAAFGASPDQVAEAVESGLSATVDDLLLVRETPESVLALAETHETNIPRRWLVHLIESPNPLHERMTLFWHDRFATSRRVLNGSEGNLALYHWELLRKHALGNYRDFLYELTVDPLELIWLSGAENSRESPNENYAREFWELFTLGRDVLYTEDDIREAARAFTGITLIRESGLDPRPAFDLLNHDDGGKNIFPGRAAPANYDYHGVIDLTLDQPEAARYVARNLFALFVHDHPSDAVVADLADGFAASGFEIAPLVRRILTSEAMFSDDARGNQISSPVEHVIGVARTLDMHMESEESQGDRLNRMSYDLSVAGQELLNPPSVAGWDDNAGWLKDQWLIGRASALGQVMDYGPDRTPDLPYHLLPPVDSWDRREVRGEIVDALAQVFHLELTDDERDIYIEVLDQNGWRAFHLEEPDNQPRQVYETIRLMAMHEGVIGR